MVIRVISSPKITSKKVIWINKDIADILGINYGDDILYILNKNGIVNIRKFEGEVILGPGEIYLSSSKVYNNMGNLAVSITTDVRQIIDVDIGDRVLCIVDSDTNVIIRNTFLLNICSIDVLNKNVSALVIDTAQFWHQTNHTVLPKDIVDILGVDKGDIITLSIDESDNIVVNQKIVKNLLQKDRLHKNALFTISKEVINILDITTGNRILWIIDEDGNIIMRNAILSDSCI